MNRYISQYICQDNIKYSLCIYIHQSHGRAIHMLQVLQTYIFILILPYLSIYRHCLQLWFTAICLGFQHINTPQASVEKKSHTHVRNEKGAHSSVPLFQVGAQLWFKDRGMVCDLTYNYRLYANLQEEPYNGLQKVTQEKLILWSAP